MFVDIVIHHPHHVYLLLHAHLTIIYKMVYATDALLGAVRAPIPLDARPVIPV